MTKLLVELLSLLAGSIGTFFMVRKFRRKLRVCLYLLLWHLRLCPDGMGLKGTR
jgi:hypothetical protein